MDKEHIKTFTPEELGLKRTTVEGRNYIDITPFWIDSVESRRIQDMLQGEASCPEDVTRKGDKRK